MKGEGQRGEGADQKNVEVGESKVVGMKRLRILTPADGRTGGISAELALRWN